MKLSKECIEAIEGLFPRYAMQRVAATEALTNPSIFEKAGLISLEDALGFAEWCDDTGLYYKKKSKIWISLCETEVKTTAQLFQIYQQQK